MLTANILASSAPSKIGESLSAFSASRINSRVGPPSSTPASPENLTVRRRSSRNEDLENPLLAPSNTSSRFTLTTFLRSSTCSCVCSRRRIISRVSGPISSGRISGMICGAICGPISGTISSLYSTETLYTVKNLRTDTPVGNEYKIMFWQFWFGSLFDISTCLLHNTICFLTVAHT